MPTDFSNPSLAQSLALVPPGLPAVAVFPPFEIPRTLPANAVIFTENPTRRKRKKRWVNRILKFKKKVIENRLPG